MIFTERIEKLLGANHIKEVIDEFLKFLNDVPQSSKDARADANQLRGQIIVLSGRFTELNSKVNTNTIDQGAANQEKSMLINSFIQILNQLPSSYPDLNKYLDEKNEDDEWKAAQEENKIEAYQVYFSKYPNGKYKAATIKLIAELEDVKLKQDQEIKRLALLEKERRENDKAAAEAQRSQQTTTGTQTGYSSIAQVNRPPAARSNKALYIIIGAVVGIILIVVIANMSSKDNSITPVYNNTESSSAPATNETAVQTGVSESVKAELISAIRLADATEINVFYSLDPTPLYASYAGEALKTALSEIEYLKNNDLFATQTLDNQEFQDFTVSSDGKEAEVKLVETWSTMYSRISTQQCVSRTGSIKYPQKLYLKKNDNGWIITSMVHENLAAPNLLPCN